MTVQKSAILDAEAIIFDVDGTLVDTVDFHAEAWRQAFSKFGLEIGFQEIRGQIGKGGDQLLPVFLSREQLDREGEEIEALRSRLFKRDYLPKVRGFPDVKELLETLSNHGAIVALGSSAKGEELEAYKKAAGIERLRLVEVTSDDAEKSKPHPDIFEVALQKTGTAAAGTLVVGDTPYDAQAAAKAGIRTIGVLCGGFDEALLRDAGAFEVYGGPTDMLRAIKATM